MKRVLVCFGVAALCGCVTAPPYSSDASIGGYEQFGLQPQESLFSGDSAVLSDADIRRILEFQYVPPLNARLALLPLGQERWYGYSDELARSSEQIRSELTATLEQANSVASADFLPSLLVPRSRTVAYFREAAARYQAELMLVYQASCQTYEKYRFFRANESRSYCTVEALLLDIRTGIVPFTTSATDEFQVEQESRDSGIHETRRRAELSAVATALNRVGDATVAYLSGSRE